MVYFIKCQEYIKIGYSNNPNDRISQLQTSIPYKLQVVSIIMGTMHDEKKLHKLFKEHHVRGEWFRVSIEILEYIESKKNLMWNYGYDDPDELDIYELNPLKALRVSRGFSMEDVAEKMGVTKQSYCEAENRCMQGRITIGTLAKYGRLLGGKLQIRFKQI